MFHLMSEISKNRRASEIGRSLFNYRGKSYILLGFGRLVAGPINQGRIIEDEDRVVFSG